MTKINYDLPRESKTYFIEPISETTHIKSQLLKRFVKFYQNIIQCDKPHVRYLARIQADDFRSTFGRNVQNIYREAKVKCMNLVDINTLKYSNIPQDEEWRVPLLKECFEMKAGRLESNLTQKEITHIINTVSI